MTREIVSLAENESMDSAYNKMQRYNIRHLPVLDWKRRVLGVFTLTDLNRAYPPRETETGWYYSKEELNLLNLKHFMTKDPILLTPSDTLREAAAIAARTKIGCIPIVDPETRAIVGILSVVDILRKISEQL